MKQLTWVVNSVEAIERLGYIPQFLFEDDPRPAKEQFNERYAHGGGWFPFKSAFKFINEEGKEYALVYPSGSDFEPDERYKPVGVAKLRDEVIIVFENAWVIILQKDGTWECSRMD